MSADTARTGGTSFLASTRLIAEREIRTQTASKGFWINFGVIVVGIFVLSIVPGLFGGGEPSVATVGSDAARVAEAAELDTQPVPDRASAEVLVQAGDVDAAIVPDPEGSSPLGLRIVAEQSSPDDIVAALSVSPPVDLLNPSEVSDGLQFLVVFLFALVFFMASFIFGMAIAQSVVTEKQTRIIEILVATVPVRALLTGKIAGHSVLAFGQITVIALATPVALRLGGHDDLLSTIAGPLGWFVPFFALGFVLLACMWAVAGSMVSRQEDLGSSTSLVSTLIMIPYFGVIFFRDNDLVMTVLSYVPFSAPLAMPARLFSGDAQGWEPVVTLVILIVAVAASIMMASRLYSGSLLQTGARVRLGRAWARTD
ncbi:ABC transporter permease [Phytoactinopolyspora limicola]|uniref:ABC transporter permease n=1 Tax=Phytoactinopolyspora limicola TaxID=2715536 RepID=UPI001409EF9D|nr:ABC transporter permease [Phytoactinopolyspora limicola]